MSARAGKPVEAVSASCSGRQWGTYFTHFLEKWHLFRKGWKGGEFSWIPRLFDSKLKVEKEQMGFICCCYGSENTVTPPSSLRRRRCHSLVFPKKRNLKKGGEGRERNNGTLSPRQQAALWPSEVISHRRSFRYVCVRDGNTILSTRLVFVTRS